MSHAPSGSDLEYARAHAFKQAIEHLLSSERAVNAVPVKSPQSYREVQFGVNEFQSRGASRPRAASAHSLSILNSGPFAPSPTSQSSPQASSSSEGIESCWVCGSFFGSKVQIMDHLVSMHDFECCQVDGCGQVVSYKQAGSHFNRHHRAYACAQCGVSVKGYGQVKPHVKLAHSIAAPFTCICDHCGLFFTTPARWSTHMALVHCCDPASSGVGEAPRQEGYVNRLPSLSEGNIQGVSSSNHGGSGNSGPRNNRPPGSVQAGPFSGRVSMNSAGKPGMSGPLQSLGQMQGLGPMSVLSGQSNDGWSTALGAGMRCNADTLGLRSNRVVASNASPRVTSPLVFDSSGCSGRWAREGLSWGKSVDSGRGLFDSGRDGERRWPQDESKAAQNDTKAADAANWKALSQGGIGIGGQYQMGINQAGINQYQAGVSQYQTGASQYQAGFSLHQASAVRSHERTSSMHSVASASTGFGLFTPTSNANSQQYK